MKKTYLFLSGIGKASFLLILLMMLVPIIGSAQTNIAPQAIVSAMGTGAPGCMTGACSTVNDLNLGSCGSQQMWISTSGPPSTVPGDDYIQFDFPTPKTFDEIIIHHATSNTARFLSGGLIQYWDGSNWVTHHHFTNLPAQCISSIPFQKVTASRFRITSFELNGPGQNSNPNFREIEVISAPTSFNDAMVLSVDSPIVFCTGFNDVYATIGNYGLNQLNSVEIHWNVNGISMPTIFYGQLLDTLNGNFPNTVQLMLGSVNLNAGNNFITVYTANPNGATDGFQYNDTFNIVLTTASAPDGLVFSNVSLNSTDINVLGGSGSYEYEYGTKGFSLGNGTFGSTSSSTFTISGLNPGTSYDVYIRTNCGGGDVSAWIGPFSVYTAAAAPFIQTFESFGFNNGISDMEGWNSTNTVGLMWYTGTNTPSGNTGPIFDHTIGSGGTFAYLETSSGSTGDFDTLMSPAIFVDSSATSLTVDFWYHMHGATTGRLEIYIDTNGVTNLIDTIVGEQHLSETDPWTLHSTILSGYEGSTVRLIFKGFKGTGITGDLAIDDVRVMKTPSCIEPGNLFVSNVTTNAAELNWTEKNVATQWEIEYGPQGFTKGNGTVVIANSNPFTITGLNPSSNYTFYVRSICGRGDTSLWTLPSHFITSFATPYLQDFENFGDNTGGISAIEGWNSFATSDPQWQTGTTTSSGATGPVQDHTIGAGGTFVYLETSGGSTGDYDSLVSPAIMVDTNVSSLTFSFWYHMHGATMGDLEIYLDTNGVIIPIDTISGQQHLNETDPWTNYSVQLTGFAGSSVKIIFKGIRGTSFTGDMAIDDVSLMQTPTCIRPSNITLNNATFTSAQLGWTENNLSTQWEIEYGPSGFTPGMGTSAFVTANPYNITGLTNGPDFDFYVRSICGRGDTSMWTGPFDFRTMTYSVTTQPPLTDNNGSSGITFNVGANVDLKITEIMNIFNAGSISYTIWYTTDSINGPPNVSTTNNWILHQTGTVTGLGGTQVGVKLNSPIEMSAGDVYGFMVEAGTRYHTYAVGDPTVFANGEIYLNTGTNIGYGGGAPNPTNHVRQFLGTVVYELDPKADNNAGVESIDSLLAFCPGPNDVYATIVNDGLNRIDSVEVHWEVNGVVQPMVHYTQLLDTNNGTFPSSASILLGNVNLVNGNNTIKVYTSLPNGLVDTLNQNDTLEVDLLAPSSPSGANFLNITATTVDVDVVGSAGTTIYQYGTTGFFLGGGITDSSATSTFNISGLTPNTVYDIYIRNNCGGNTSAWAGPFTFETPCSSVNTYPFLEDFTSALSKCWSEATDGTPVSGPLAVGTSDWNSGNFMNDATFGNGMKINLYFNNDQEWLISPVFDFSTAGPFQLRMDAALTPWLGTTQGIFGSDDEVQVLISTNGGVSWNNLYTWNGANPPVNASPKVTIDLSAYNGNSNMFAIWATDGLVDDPEDNDFHIDNFEVRPTPTCLEPTQLNVTNLSTTSATLNWLEMGVSTQWEIEYGLGSFTQGNGTSILVTSNPYTINGLLPSTTYEFYVRSACGRGDTSYWSGPFVFSTSRTIPVFEDFEDFGSISPAIKDGWNVLSQSGLQWQTGTTTSSGSTGPDADHTIGSGGTFVFLETSSGSTGDTSHFISPSYYLDTNFNSVNFEFWYHKYGATMDNLLVYLVSNGQDSLLTTISGQTHTSGTDPWLQYTTVLTGYAGQEVQIRFSGVRGSSFTGDMAIDDVSLSVDIPIDGGLTSFLAPSVQTCYTSSENVVVELVNNGLDTLDFTVDSALVTVNVAGASSQSISFMVNNNSINSGNPLAPMDTISVLVGTVDMTNPGTYFFNASLGILNDGLSANDLLSDTVDGNISGMLAGATSLCLGDSATLFITGHRGSNQWQSSTGGAFTDIPGATGGSVKVGPNASTQYRVLTCGSLVSDTITVNPTIPAVPVTNDSLTTVNCGNAGVVALIATSTNANAKFEWYSTSTGGNPLRVGGNIFDISLYGDTLYYQATPSQGTQSIDTFYVQEIVLSGSGICASSRDTAVATIDCIVGIEESGEVVSNISIHPNPSNGVFNIVGKDVLDEVEISLYNFNGKLVYHSSEKYSNSFEERIDLSGMAKGLYFVKIQSKNSTETMKIVVQ